MIILETMTFKNIKVISSNMNIQKYKNYDFTNIRIKKHDNTDFSLNYQKMILKTQGFGK